MMHPRFRFRTLLLLGSVLIPVTFASPVLAQVTAPEGEEELLSLPPVDDAAQPSEAAPVVAPLETQAPIPAPSPEPIPEPPAAVESEEPAAALEPLPEPVAAPEAAPATEMEAAPPAPAMPDNADNALPEAPLPVAGGTEPEGDVVDAAADGAP
ncbi:MAG: hypothetical protein FJX23_00875, partial [Alphaproteobacteria bacterium]|nr:hypothetical protein [Alphaproteobacteria bacterium]